MKLQNPWPANRRITSPFGYRIHPITGGRKLHRGVDVAGRFPVTAAEEGEVVHIGWNRTGGGHVVILKHGTRLYTVYYHGRTATKLRKGQRVPAGEFIYDSGSTGASTGDHLHFEVRTSRVWGTQVNPEPYLTGSSAPTGRPLSVNGRLDRATIRRWQEVLKDAGHNVGLVDGKIGPRTIRGIQKAVNVRADGVLGPITRRAVQRHLGVRDDGVWGRVTISALQRRLNEGKF
jgi:hypothetical protein